MLQIGVGTAPTIIVGPILDTSGLPYSGSLAYTDFAISKAGGSGPVALSAAATATHYGQGSYKLVLTANDTNVEGYAEIILNKASYAMQAKDLLIATIPTLVRSILDSAAAFACPSGIVLTGAINTTLYPAMWLNGVVKFQNGIVSCYFDGASVWTINNLFISWTLTNPYPSGTYTSAGQPDIIATAATEWESAPPASPVAGSRDALLVTASTNAGGGGGGGQTNNI